MSGPIERRVLRLVYIRRYDAVEIAPADDNAHSYAALIDAFGVIADPDDGVGDAGVDAEGAEESAGELDAGGGSALGVSWGSNADWDGCLPGKEHAEADHTHD